MGKGAEVAGYGIGDVEQVADEHFRGVQREHVEIEFIVSGGSGSRLGMDSVAINTPYSRYS
jgi:hypothetical protein